MPGAQVTDVDVTLLKAGVATGPNQANLLSWPTVATLVSYSWAGADLAAFSATDFNSPTFGVQLSAQAGGALSAQVDYVQITITYTVANVVHSMTSMGAGQ